MTQKKHYTDEEVAKKREEVSKLREELAKAEAKKGDEVASASNAIAVKRLDDEAEMLRAKIKARGGASVATREVAAPSPPDSGDNKKKN